MNLNRPFTKYEAFKDLIKLANHEDRKIPFDGNSFRIMRGQHLTSQVKLAIRWNWKRRKAGRFLENLKKGGEIDYKTTTQYTLITISNYCHYQNRHNQSRPSDDHQMTDCRPPIDHKQELKELKNSEEYNIIKYFSKKYQEKFGIKYSSKGQRDLDACKSLLKDYSIQMFKKMVKRFFDSNDPFIIKSDYAISVFKHMANKLAKESTTPYRNKTEQELWIEQVNREFDDE